MGTARETGQPGRRIGEDQGSQILHSPAELVANVEIFYASRVHRPGHGELVLVHREGRGRHHHSAIKAPGRCSRPVSQTRPNHRPSHRDRFGASRPQQCERDRTRQLHVDAKLHEFRLSFFRQQLPEFCQFDFREICLTAV